MAKVELDLVKMVLQRNEVDIRTVAQVVEDLNQELKLQSDEERPPAVKKQFVILISDPNGDIPKDTDFTGWVLQIPEDDGVYVSEERLLKAAYAYNQSPKGRRMPVQTVGEACEHVPARFFKEEAIWVKTKEPVFVLKTSNSIPQQ